MESKKVNILVATYNGEKYLSELLESLLAQTYSNREIYILDDESKDRSLEIATQFLSKGIKIIENHENHGYPYSFFKLLRECDQADYYCLCDQDDVWYPNKVADSVRKLEETKTEKIKLCFSAFEYCDENLNHLRYSDDPPEKITFIKTFFQCYLWGFTVAFDEKFRQKFLNNLPQKTKDEDYWFQMMAVGFGKIVYCQDVCAKHRRHGGNHSTDPTNFIRFQLWRISYFLKENKFAQYHAMLQEFYKYHKNDLNEGDKKHLELFQSDGNALRKFFFPKRLRSGLLDEVLLRLAFLIGKL